MTIDIELALRDLRQHLDWPAEVNVALTPRRAPSRRLIWVAAAASLLIVIALLPAGREAVASLARVLGIQIEFRDAPEVAEGLNLGPEVGANKAAAAVDFELALPTSPGSPDAFYLREPPLATQVWTVWEPTNELPQIPGSNAGLILAQFRADPEEESITKLVSAGIAVISVDVNGGQGFWIAGGPHALVFNDGDFAEASRSNGNVLIWTHGEITYRLETALNLVAALELARNLEPFGT